MVGLNLLDTTRIPRRTQPMTWLALLCLLPLAAAANNTLDVTVQPLSGAAQVGSLVALDTEQVVVEVDGQQVSIPIRDLMALTNNGAAPAAPPVDGTYLALVDGSRLMGTNYRVTNRVAELLVGGRTVSLETRNIRSVRFHAPTKALDQQWQEIVTGQAQGDVIVLRRSETALDQLEGIFHNVDVETVEFEYDDQKIPVKRVKLEGLVYFHPLQRDLPQPLCVLHETGGSRWQARSLTWQEDQVALVTTSGVKIELAWPQVARLDFSQGNVVQLSELEYELVSCEPFYASRLPQETILATYGPQRDRSFAGPGLWLSDADGVVQKFEQGLAIHSRSELVYRLAEPYRRLTARVGLDSRPRQRGNLVLVIAGDDKELLRQTISGNDPPIDLNLNIEGVRRLRILVDYGDSLDVADHLNLCNARIIK